MTYSPKIEMFVSWSLSSFSAWQSDKRLWSRSLRLVVPLLLPAPHLSLFLFLNSSHFLYFLFPMSLLTCENTGSQACSAVSGRVTFVADCVSLYFCLAKHLALPQWDYKTPLFYTVLLSNNRLMWKYSIWTIHWKEMHARPISNAFCK